jgi:hypothetical protein
MSEFQSVTGRQVSGISLSNEDRGRLWAYLYPLAALPSAIQHQQWFPVAFWVFGLVGATAVAKFGQHRDARTFRQKVFFVLVSAVALGLVMGPGQHSASASIVGLAMGPIPFLVDVMLARGQGRGSRS